MSEFEIKKYSDVFGGKMSYIPSSFAIKSIMLLNTLPDSDLRPSRLDSHTCIH